MKIMRRKYVFVLITLLCSCFFLLYLVTSGSEITKRHTVVDFSLDQQKDECLENVDHKRKIDLQLLPDVDIFLRMYGKLVNYYEELLLPSMRFFLTGDVSLVIVLDGESQADRKMGKVLQKKYPYPKVCFQGAIDPDIYHGKGHERMQRDYFYPEKFTSRKYVGYIDTDTVFITRLTRNLFFEDGKPVIIGIYGPASDPFWYNMAVLTEYIFNAKEVIKCMGYFPVIFQVKHIVELRAYLEALHKKPFDEIFRDYSKHGFGQFNIMCQYVWLFRRNDYAFYFQRRTATWQGEGNSPGREPPLFYNVVLTPQQTVPRIRSSIHYRHIVSDEWKRNDTLRSTLRTGICYSGGFDVCPDICNDLNRTAIHRDLFMFEGSTWTWDDRCLDEQNKHYNFVKKITNKEIYTDISKACKTVNHLTFTTTENN